jgi:hypothetical protein
MTKLDELLAQYPEFEKLCVETEKLRVTVDSISDSANAFRFMIDIDNNMMTLLNYHMELSTECLRRVKELT